MANVDSSILPYLEGIATAEEYAKALRAVTARGGSNPLPTKHEKWIVDSVNAAKRRATRRAARQRKAERRKGEPKEPKLPQFVGTYHEYLKSPQWKQKIRKAKRHYGNKCTVCGTTYGLQCHHRHYKTLFREDMKDLNILCGGCHANHHERDKGAVDPMTARFLEVSRSF